MEKKVIISHSTLYTGFLLVMTQADGQKKVEHVDQPSELIEKSVDQMKQLREDGWKIG